ncbi:MAG: phage gp6-like head-tail connector protein [Methanobrevibacter sp.]|nr:phage gp6-like head-tail connector protein [Methanobrevibacter sp.]
MVKIEDVKNSLRIDHDLDDDLIDQLINTASSYIKSAIDSEALDGESEGYRQFEWSVSLLAQHWYLNRQEATSERMPITVQALIQQMRGAYYATH